MKENTERAHMRRIFGGKAKAAILIAAAIFVMAVILIVTMACSIPHDRKFETQNGNFLDIVTYDSGKWLYATSDGSIVRMSQDGNAENTSNIVSLAGDTAGFGSGILRKFYKAPDSEFVWGIISALEPSNSPWLFRAKDTEEGFEILDCVPFQGNVENTYLLEQDDYFYVVCAGQQIAEILRYRVDDLAAGVICQTVLYDCTPDDKGIKLRAIQMSNGVDCFESDGEYLYILYDGGFIRLAVDFSDVRYESSSREYIVSDLDTSKYLSFGFFGVSSRGGAFIEEEGRFYIVDRSVYMYTFETSKIDSLEIGEDLTCDYVSGLIFQSSPEVNSAVYYDAATEKGYVLHESSSRITRVDFAAEKIDFSFQLEFNIAKVVQGASADDIYYIYRNVNETGQSDKTVLAYTNAALKRNEEVFRGFMTAGICLAVASAVVIVILGVIVARGKQEQALKVVKKIYKQKFIYLALVPSLILLMMFCYYEAIASIGLSFFDYTLERPTMIWNNFANYKAVFGSSLAGEAFGNMVLFLCFDLVVSLVPPLLFAFFLSIMRWDRLSNIIRTLLFITGIVPSVAGMLIWRTGIYGGDGVLNFIIESLGGEPIAFLGQTAYAKWSVLFIGFPFVGAYLIFYGGMMNISSSYFEAAELEGIGIWKRFFSIDLPLIIPQLKYVFITSFIHSLQNFSRTYMVTGGQFGTYTPIHIMYQNMVEGNYGLASAYATVIFILLFFATFVNLRKQKRSLED